MKTFDFIAVGDIVTDAFIRLKDASVTCNVNHEDCMLSVRFGDKVPYEGVEVVRAVGNSANAAVSAARLGLSSALVTNLGDDQNGKECIEVLEHEGVSTDFVKAHSGKETNYHYVLSYEAERTILVKHQEYEYRLPDMGAPRWLYLSSLGEITLPYHDEIAKYLSLHPTVKMAFQPGTFQMKMGREKLHAIYEHAEVFFCNVEEAKKILGITGEMDIEALMRKVAGLGPKIVVITDGPRGAYVFDSWHSWFMPPYPDPKPAFERTGAGDAFASTFTAALALDLSVPQALAWGPINSMAVVQEVGARKGLLSRDALENLLANAPEDYKPKLLG